MAAQLDIPTGTIERPFGEFSPDIMARLHSKGLDWQRLTGSPRFDYLIDYSGRCHPRRSGGRPHRVSGKMGA